MANEQVAVVATAIRAAWRESGACATYSEPYDNKTRRCAACGRGETAHALLKWAEQLDRISRAEDASG